MNAICTLENYVVTFALENIEKLTSYKHSFT